MTATGGNENLYSSSEVNGLCVAWVAFWIVCHHICWSCSASRLGGMLTCRQPSQSEIYARRICRSQIYCAICMLGAIVLLMRCRQVPQDLLNDYTPQHQFFFSMAVGHWIVSIWEDWRTPRFLCAGLDAKALVGIREPSMFLLQAYTAHHLVAAFGFWSILQLHHCTGVGTFGLLFELPVFLLNRRELAMNASVTQKWLLSPKEVRTHWQWFYVLFVIGRVGPIMVYVYSLGYWQDAIASLRTTEKVLYHGMSIFFTLLNYAFLNVLCAWHRRDIAAARDSSREVRPADFDLEDAEEFGGSKNGGRSIDPNASPLRQVDHFLLEQHDGKTPGVPLWVDVDGAAYDVTKFLSEHPGGEKMLKETGGTDPGESFKLLCQCHATKSSLVRYLIGPIKHPPVAYNYFAHNEECTRCGKMLLALFSAVGLNLLLLRPFAFGAFLTPTQAMSTNQILLGLLLVATMGIISSGLSFVWRTSTVPSSWCSKEVHIVAMCTVIYVVSLTAVCQNVSPEVSSSAPTGIEICAAVLLVQQFFIHRKQFALYEDMPVILLVPAGISWLIRGCMSHIEGYAWILMSIGLLAMMLRMVLIQFETSRGRSRDEVFTIFLRGVGFAVVYAALGIAALTYAKPEAATTLQELISSPLCFVASLLSVSIVSLAALGTLVHAASSCTAPFAMRASALTMVLVNILQGYVFQYAWVALLGFGLHFHSMYRHQMVRLRWCAEINRFQIQVAEHCVGVHAFCDMSRIILATLLWRLLTIPVQSFISYCLPDELRVYSCEIPVFDLGPETQLGVAAHIAPHLSKESESNRQAKSQVNPDYFVCNVGQISNSDNRGLGDVQRTMNTLREIWQEFQDPPTPGLVANVVAVFPEIEEQGVTKEINLSAWESARDAHDWYVKSPGHKRVLHQHTSGLLQTFGNLLCSLQPAEPVRHQDRCRHCMRIVESEEPGKPAPRRCGVCGGPTYGFPVF